MTTRIEIHMAQDILYGLVNQRVPLSSVAPQLQELSFMLDDLVQLHDLLDELDIPTEQDDTCGLLNLAQRVRLLATHHGFRLDAIPDNELSQLAFNLF